MNKVEVLVEGYAKVNKDESWEASSTITLIESNGKKIICDPGCDRKLLDIAFNTHGLKFTDIDWVFVSHRHLDHNVLMGVFPKARVIDDELFQYGPHGEMHEKIMPGTDIKIISTPGHAPRHASLLVKTNMGVLAIAGDVFWWKQDEKQEIKINKKDDFADGEFKDLVESRKSLLKMADWIIPGHGRMFKVP